MRTTTAMGALFAAMLLAGPAPAQETNWQKEFQQVKQQLRDLEAKFEGRGAAPKTKGFLSQLGEHINLTGKLEFEIFGAESENIPIYTGNVGRVRGTDMRIDSLTLGAVVIFIEDVYLNTELQLRGGNEDKTTANEFEIYLPELYFGFDRVLIHLAGLDDPTYTRIEMGAMRPWQHKLFPRHTETYGLAQTAFYRDSRVGIRIGGRTAKEYGFFYNLCLDDGNDLMVVHAGDNNLGYAQMLADDEANARMSHTKDVEIGLGWQQEWSNNVGLKAAAWYRTGRLSSADRVVLGQARLGLGNLDGSHKKRRFGIIAAGTYNSDWGEVGVQAEWHDAHDANMHRQAFGIQPSIRFAFDGNIYGDRKFFTGMRMLYRFSNLDTFGPALTVHSVPFTQLGAADMQLHTLGLNVEVTSNVQFKFEYNIFQLDTRNTVHADEFVLHLGVAF